MNTILKFIEEHPAIIIFIKLLKALLACQKLALFSRGYNAQ